MWCQVGWHRTAQGYPWAMWCQVQVGHVVPPTPGFQMAQGSLSFSLYVVSSSLSCFWGGLISASTLSRNEAARKILAAQDPDDEAADVGLVRPAGWFDEDPPTHRHAHAPVAA